MKFPQKLNEFDVLDLLNEYHSELRKLKYKLGYVKGKISELESEHEAIKRRNERAKAAMQRERTQDTEELDYAELEEVEMEEPEVETEVEKEEVQAKPVKPVKVKAAKPVVKKKAAKKKAVKKVSATPTTPGRKGRKPQGHSYWDQLIMDSVTQRGEPVISRFILEDITARAIAEGQYEDEEKTRVKLNQCLVKLTSDRKKALVTAPYAGRGHAYALPEWMEK
jgi:hypothetical protein